MERRPSRPGELRRGKVPGKSRGGVFLRRKVRQCPADDRRAVGTGVGQSRRGLFDCAVLESSVLATPKRSSQPPPRRRQKQCRAARQENPKCDRTRKPI